MAKVEADPHDLSMNSEPGPLLSVEETANLLKVTRTTVYEWIRRDELPAVKLGGRIRVPIAKLADLIGLSVEDLWASMGPGDDAA